MRKATKSVRTWLALTVFALILSCSAAELIPVLENRTLEIHPDKPALYYDHCIKYKLFSYSCKEWKTDIYDLTNPVVRAELRAMGFRAQSKQRGRM